MSPPVNVFTRWMLHGAQGKFSPTPLPGGRPASKGPKHIAHAPRFSSWVCVNISFIVCLSCWCPDHCCGVWFLQGQFLLLTQWGCDPGGHLLAYGLTGAHQAFSAQHGLPSML